MDFHAKAANRSAANLVTRLRRGLAGVDGGHGVWTFAFMKFLIISTEPVISVHNSSF